MSALPPIATAKADFRTSPCPLYPPKADMCGATWDVRFGPKADIQSTLLRLVGGRLLGRITRDRWYIFPAPAHCRLLAFRVRHRLPATHDQPTANPRCSSTQIVRLKEIEYSQPADEF